MKKFFVMLMIIFAGIFQNISFAYGYSNDNEKPSFDIFAFLILVYFFLWLVDKFIKPKNTQDYWLILCIVVVMVLLIFFL